MRRCGKRKEENVVKIIIRRRTKSNTNDKVDTGVGTDIVSLIAVENRIMN